VEAEGDGVRANWTMRLLPIVLALAISVGLLATLTHSPDHAAADQPSAAAADRHHCSAVAAAGQSSSAAFAAILTAESADESGNHSNVASCLAALLVVIGGLLAGLRLLAAPTSCWLARRQPPFRVRLGSISAVLHASNAVRLSRLLI
jgi:hypothetical protein